MFVITSITAQDKSTKKGDKYFYRFEFVKAVEEYLELVDKGQAYSYVYKQLADSYYNMYNAADAITWYKRIADSKQTDPEVFFRYSQMLKSRGEYEEANKQMVEFSRLAPTDARAKSFLANPNYLPTLLDIRKAYKVSYLSINSDKSDFGAVLLDKTLYFTSARNLKSRIYGWLGEPYLDMYQATYVDTSFVNPQPITSLNTKYHDGPATITADGKTIYFSADSFLNKKYQKDKEHKNKMGQVNLFVAQSKDTTWTDIKELPFNSGEYSNSNPSISHDGKTLYFASNMPGGFGEMDIYKVSVNSDGTYGTPENLGDKVNTPANESFPFIDQDGTLYFASNGRVGLGGLDIFTFNPDKDEKAINLGKPVNSEKDDFSFTYDAASKTAFFSSNRLGQDNIYSGKPICNVQTIVNVTDVETDVVLSAADISVFDMNNDLLFRKTSNTEGQLQFYAECNKSYTIKVAKSGYENEKYTLVPTNGGELIIDAKLKPIKAIVTETEVILKEIIFEFDKSNITEDAAFILDNLVSVMTAYPDMKIKVGSHTDNRGSDKYNMELSDSRAKSTVQYIISKGIDTNRISGEGFGETQPKVVCQKCTVEEHQINRRSEFKIVK